MHKLISEENTMDYSERFHMPQSSLKFDDITPLQTDKDDLRICLYEYLNICALMHFCI